MGSGRTFGLRSIASCKAFGGITILVNNAGIGRRAPFLELSDETWNAVLEVNLTGAFIVAQEVCRHMARAGRGSVVNLGSAAAHMAHSEQAVYSVSKAGLEALTRVMAFELAPCRGQSERGVSGHDRDGVPGRNADPRSPRRRESSEYLPDDSARRKKSPT